MELLRFYVTFIIILLISGQFSSADIRKKYSRFLQKKNKKCQRLSKKPFSSSSVTENGRYLWNGDSETEFNSTEHNYVDLVCNDIKYDISNQKITPVSPRLNIRWMKYESMIKRSEEFDKKFLQYGCSKTPFVNYAKLRILNLRVKDSGMYSCEIIRNDTGQVVKKKLFTVYVLNKENMSVPIKNMEELPKERSGKSVSTRLLSCSFKYPINNYSKIEIEWFFNGKKMNKNTSKISVCLLGRYVCSVKSPLGGFERSFRVYNADTNCSAPTWIWIVPICSLLPYIAIVALIRIRRTAMLKEKRKKQMSNYFPCTMHIEDIDSIYKQIASSATVSESVAKAAAASPWTTVSKDYCLQVHSFLPELEKMSFVSNDDLELVRKMELPRDRLNCLRKDGEPIILGSGFFGNVYKGTFLKENGDSIPVAVKVLKSNSGMRDLSYFVEEAAALIKAKDHVNVVSLVGTCILDAVTKEDDGQIISKTPILMMELADNGNLRSYLLEYRTELSRSQLGNTSVRTSSYSELVDLLNFAYQVALGMEHLTSKRILHRDLAARNVLLTKDKMVKIGDFGLSKHLFSKDYYRVVGRWEKPAKWTSPEALVDHKYTVWSDVWSYGVLVWEIFTLGAEPFPDIMPKDLYDFLRTGTRLPQPDRAPIEIYELMTSCWEWVPCDRMHFSRLVKEFQILLENAKAVKTQESLDNMIQSRDTLQTSSEVNRSQESSVTYTTTVETRSVADEDSIATPLASSQVSSTCCSTEWEKRQFIEPCDASHYDIFEFPSDNSLENDASAVTDSLYLTCVPNVKTIRSPSKSTQITHNNSLQNQHRTRNGLILENQTYLEAKSVLGKRGASQETPSDSSSAPVSPGFDPIMFF